LFTFLVGRRHVTRQTVRLPRANVPVTVGLPPPLMVDVRKGVTQYKNNNLCFFLFKEENCEGD